MFIVQQSDSYLWPIRLPIIAADGEVVNHEFHVHFKRLDTDQVNQLGAKFSVEDGDRALAREVVVGFGKDVGGPDGQPLPFSKEALDELLRINRAPFCIAKAFYDSIRTEIKEVAQEKNSEKPPVTG